MQTPNFLFVAFTGISTLGAYLIIAHHHGRKAGALGGAVTFLFFALLFWGVHTLLRQGGFA
jgi:hypothetical protein